MVPPTGGPPEGMESAMSLVPLVPIAAWPWIYSGPLRISGARLGVLAQKSVGCGGCRGEICVGMGLA